MADRLHRGAGRGAKWRYTLPETENVSNARAASPLVFRSSTPKHDDDSNQISGLDKNNDSQSGGKKRKLSSDSYLIQKKGKEMKKTKWVWSDDKEEEMLKFLREYKSICDFHLRRIILLFTCRIRASALLYSIAFKMATCCRFLEMRR